MEVLNILSENFRFVKENMICKVLSYKGNVFGVEPEVRQERIHKYADMFDVSMDYIFARTDAPEGKMYKFQPKIPPDREEMQKFIEMCFVPGSIANTKLKESLYRIMEEKE